ncbi:MAG: stage II sporulation protein M [Gemmatimonadales bacterium]|nr:stage II sporulation protein M [Gemmatimonadales bacterium]
MPTDYRQHLEVETPEHVVLDLEIAGIGSRALAAIVDMLILTGGFVGGLLAFSILVGFGLDLGSWGSAILLLGGFAAWTGYFIFFEGLRRGQTPGKRMVGIRVLMDTGHAVTPAAATVRNLLRLADFLPPPYFLGALLVAFHPGGKRLGDLVAGTVVARDRPGEAPAPFREMTPDRSRAALPELADTEYRLLEQFERRRKDLPPAARDRLAAKLVDRLGAAPPGGVAEADHLVALYQRERSRREGGLGRSGLAVRKRERWDQFQRLAERAARGGLDSFASHELPDFAARYREVAADLARARTYREDDATISRLERLVGAGHNALYRDERSPWRALAAALLRECPGAIVRARGYVLVACLAFVAPAAAGFALLRDRPALAAELLPDVMLRRAEAGTERRAAGRRYVDVAPEDRPLMASGIIVSNVRVAIACFAGGIFLGVGSLLLLGFNGLLIGATAGHFANAGLLDYLLEFILGHGLLELFAIWVAGAAGFLLGRSVLVPGSLRRSDALVLSGRTAVRMVGGAAVMLVVAGTIEGFVSAGTGGYRLRFAASVGSLVFLALYLFNGRRAAAGEPPPLSPLRSPAASPAS